MKVLGYVLPGVGGPATVVSLFLGAAVTLAGCGGQTIAGGLGTELGPATAWVFDGGPELALAWHLFPMVDMATVGAGACYDGKIVVLCNLGGQSEVLRPSHAYVLSLQDGRILKSIPGPTGLSYPHIRITPGYAYFSDSGRWKAFDLSKGAVTSSPPVPPDSGGLPLARRYPLIQEQRDGKRVWQYRLGKRYRLLVAGTGRTLSFDLYVDRAPGKVERIHLCRLPDRIYPGGDNLLFLDDGKRLLFSWSWYLICVNVPAGPESVAWAVPPTGRARKRRPMAGDLSCEAPGEAGTRPPHRRGPGGTGD